MTWPQLYDPFGNTFLSTLVAAVPVLTLFFVLVVLKARVWVAAFSGMLAAILLANLVFGMPVTPASVRIGLPTPPQATGAVLATRQSTAA